MPRNQRSADWPEGEASEPGSGLRASPQRFSASFTPDTRTPREQPLPLASATARRPLAPANQLDRDLLAPFPSSSVEETASANKTAQALKRKALAYLTRREHSRAELFRKLARHAPEGGALDLLLDALENEGWLSDMRFAESLVHRRAARTGSARILSELKTHAVEDTLLATIAAQLRDSELTRAQAVWRKKFDAWPNTPAERAKQIRFLALRGFSQTTIGALFKQRDD